MAQLTLGEARSNEQVAFEEHMRKQSWEQGQIDYLGRDSFDNIWKKISETLSAQSEREETPPLVNINIIKLLKLLFFKHIFLNKNICFHHTVNINI